MRSRYRGAGQVSSQHRGDSLVVLERQRTSTVTLRAMASDLAGGFRIALSLEDLREQTSDGYSQSHAGDPHCRDATELHKPLAHTRHAGRTGRGERFLP